MAHLKQKQGNFQLKKLKQQCSRKAPFSKRFLRSDGKKQTCCSRLVRWQMPTRNMAQVKNRKQQKRGKQQEKYLNVDKMKKKEAEVDNKRCR